LNRPPRCTDMPSIVLEELVGPGSKAPGDRAGRKPMVPRTNSSADGPQLCGHGPPAQWRFVMSRDLYHHTHSLALPHIMLDGALKPLDVSTLNTSKIERNIPAPRRHCSAPRRRFIDARIFNYEGAVRRSLDPRGQVRRLSCRPARCRKSAFSNGCNNPVDRLSLLSLAV
jgi:hypothetical protein